jgi:hypothetical protein
MRVTCDVLHSDGIMLPAGRVLPSIEPFDILDPVDVENVTCVITRKQLDQQPMPQTAPATSSSSGGRISGGGSSGGGSSSSSGGGSSSSSGGSSSNAASAALDPLAYLDTSSFVATAAATPSTPPLSSIPEAHATGQQQRAHSRKQRQLSPTSDQLDEQGGAQQSQSSQQEASRRPQLDDALRQLRDARLLLSELRGEREAVVGERQRVQEVMLCQRVLACDIRPCHVHGDGVRVRM